MSAVSIACPTIELRQHVRVKGTEIEALVQAILLSESGIQYQISYWHDDARHVEWVLPEEIAPC